ncbi:vWA domain-containing protein [Vreelandella sulfidaeris]
MMKPSNILPIREPTAEEQTTKVQQHNLWRQEIRNWLIAYPLTAKLVMRLKLVMVVDSRVLTACTDGVNVFINAHFASQCSSALRRFVLGHELYHVLLGHFIRQYGRDRLYWNLAVDAEANYRLMLDGLSMPTDAVFYPAQAGRNAETIYQWLLKHPRPDIDAPFDIHGEELFAPATMDGGSNVLVVDPDFAPLRVDNDMARLITQHWQEIVLKEAQQTSPGSIPDGMNLIVSNIAKPQVNWRTALHDFLLHRSGCQLTWNRLNRRYLAQGLYLPGRQGKALSLMLAIDTSGSTQRQLPLFIAELQALLTCVEYVEIHLIECDADIQRERIINHVQELHEIGSDNGDGLTLRGGGGTDFRPVFERANDIMSECLLFFTDGFGRTPETVPNFPVLWVITEDGKVPASWGQVVRLEDE